MPCPARLLRSFVLAFALGFLILCVPRPASAQAPAGAASVPTCTIGEFISEQCLHEFHEWFKAEVAWRKWIETNRNRVAHGVWTSVAGRRERPAVPGWLPEYCRGTFEADVTSDRICSRYNALKEYDWVADNNRAVLAQLRIQAERPTHTSFLQRVHIDTFYTAAQFPSPQVYGIVGVHVGLVPLGRCQVNVIPGTMVMTVPNGRHRQLDVAVNLGGGSCKIGSFTFPGTAQRGQLHLNLARVHIMGQNSEQVLLGGADLTLVGFSLTLK